MTQETTRRSNAATMSINERSQAIGRAQRALKALGEHPHSSKKVLGHAREHLNACYSHGSGDHVWDAVSNVETMAERRYGAPSPDEQDHAVESSRETSDPEELATHQRGRGAEDRAVPWSAPPDAATRRRPASTATNEQSRSAPDGPNWSQNTAQRHDPPSNDRPRAARLRGSDSQRSHRGDATSFEAMPESARDAALILLSIAYLGGAVLMLVTLAKVLLAWSSRWSTRRRPDTDAHPANRWPAEDPRDIDGLREQATTAMAAVASRAGVTAPAVDVVTLLGAPLTTSGGPATVGWSSRGSASAGPPTLVFASAALTGLSPAGVRSLASHEVAHVIRREHGSAAGRFAWLGGYLVLMVAGASLSVAALATSPQLGGLTLMATLPTAFAFLGLQFAFDRPEEIAADLFAVELTHDLDAAAELMRFLDEHVTRPPPAGWVARAVIRLERR